MCSPQVDFLDLATSEWRQLPSLNYKIGDKDNRIDMILVIMLKFLDLNLK